MSDCLRANASNGLQILARRSSLLIKGSQRGTLRTFKGGTAPSSLRHNRLGDIVLHRGWGPESCETDRGGFLLGSGGGVDFKPFIFLVQQHENTKPTECKIAKYILFGFV